MRGSCFPVSIFWMVANATPLRSSSSRSVYRRRSRHARNFLPSILTMPALLSRRPSRLRTPCMILLSATY